MSLLIDAKKEHFRLLDQEWDSFVNPKTGLVFEHQSESVNCPVCDSSSHETIFIKKGFTFVACSSCSHLFINPQLKGLILTNHFTSSQAWEVWSKQVLMNEEQLEADQKKYNQFLDVLGEFSESKSKRVLDVGCSSGLFLNEAKKRGWELKGLELSKAACEFAEKRFGIKVENKNLLDFESKEKFDLITFWASLEYHRNPQQIIAKAKSLLSPNGIVLILISGNSASLAMRILREHCAGFIFNRANYFNPQSLMKLMERFDFKRIHQNSIISELKPILRFLNYQDPYHHASTELSISSSEEKKMEEEILKHNMGYKFISIFKRNS